MILNDLDVKQKITIISIGLVFIAIFVLLFFLQPHNKYGSEIGINNYDKYISNLPTDRRDAINSNLYNIVELNLKSGNASINDATIRENSNVEDYNKETNTRLGSFIVDIESVKQSYLISYNWTSDNNNINVSGYTATITCLPLEKLIYGDFGCKDDFSAHKDYIKNNPILDYLPYSTFNYEVTANTNNDNKKVNLDVNIILYSYDTRDGRQDISINKYKSEITDWIKSKSLNPSDFTINYNIITHE